jgi:hypothetical protein
VKRTIPPALYDEVFALVTDIAQPDARLTDEVKAADAYVKLLALFKYREQSGDSDPFLTEALADVTDDNSESIRLYELALKQCAAFPGEGTVSKRTGLARALIEAGRTAEASAQIEIARGEAFAERDSSALKQLEELSASCAGRE